MLFTKYLNWKYCLLSILTGLFVLWLFIGVTNGDKDLHDEENKEMDDYYTDSSYISDFNSNSESDFNNNLDSDMDSDLEEFLNKSKNGKNSNSLERRKKPLGYKKPKFPKIKNKREKIPVNETTKPEQLTCKALENEFGKPFKSARPDFLKNPETGKNLELDCYNKELGIAGEYNGIQHYHWPNFTGETYQEFLNQHRRDQFKVDMCDQNGVYLITVPFDAEDIDEYIRIHKAEYDQKVAELNNFSDDDYY